MSQIEKESIFSLRDLKGHNDPLFNLLQINFFEGLKMITLLNLSVKLNVGKTTSTLFYD